MDLLRVRNLLLILLLPLSDQNLETDTIAELNHSSRSIEFCLHVPGDSHWSSSKPDKPAPRKTVHPPATNSSKQQKPKPEVEPAQTNWGSTHPVTSTDPPGQTEEDTTRQPELIPEPQPVTGEIIAVIYRGPQRSPKRCRCVGKKMKLPTETSPVRHTKVWPPTKNCRSPEFLEMLEDGREVCVTAHSFQTYFSELLQSRQKNPSTTVPPTTVPTTVDPTTELPTTTQLSPSEIRENVPQCELSTSDLENITLEAVHSMFVRMHAYPWKTLIYINLKDDNGSICVDLDHAGFQRLLENFGTLPSFPPDVTPKTSGNKCRCRDTDMAFAYKSSSVRSAMIWFPSDTCNSTEYIETLMDGSEACVTPPSLFLYFDFMRRHPIALETVVIVPDKTFVARHIDQIGTGCSLVFCPLFDWTSIDSKDVKSLQMDMDSSNCNIHLIVHLKQLDGRPDSFCVSTEAPWFSDVLKKLDIN